MLCYFRFMPEGIYLDVLKLGVQKLAKEMNNIINNPPRYYNFFKWHAYYSFQATADDNYKESVCAFCALLNKKVQRYKRTIYINIKNWWKNRSEDDTIPERVLPN